MPTPLPPRTTTFASPVLDWEVLAGPVSDEQLESAWDELACRVGAPRSSPACVMPWYSSVLDDPERIRIVVARRNGRPVGVWPLYYTRDSWGFVIYRMAGHQTIVGVEPVTAPDDGAARDALVAGLAGLRPVPDRIELECVGDEHRWLASAAAALPHWRAIVETTTSSAPYLGLDDDAYEEWMAGRRGRGGKQVARFGRRLADQGYRRRRFTEREEVHRRLPALQRLYLDRKASRGGWGADFDDPMLTMLAQIVDHLADEERAILYTVEKDATHVAAIDLVLVAGDTATAWIGGAGDVLGQYSPGQVNLTAVIEDARSACLARLSLGPGEEDYKARYSTGARRVVATVLVRRSHSLKAMNTPAALVPRGARELARQAKAVVKRR